MKIRTIETIIEADARELRECNTLGDQFAGLLKRCFQSKEPFEDDNEDSDEGENTPAAGKDET